MNDRVMIMVRASQVQRGDCDAPGAFRQTERVSASGVEKLGPHV